MFIFMNIGLEIMTDLSLSDILHQLVVSNFVYCVELYEHINSEKVSTLHFKKRLFHFKN